MMFAQPLPTFSPLRESDLNTKRGGETPRGKVMKKLLVSEREEEEEGEKMEEEVKEVEEF